jgi:hypothetical protein
VEKHHARLSAIVGAARSELGWRGPAFASVLPAYRKEAARTDNRSEDPLDLRVTDTKKRSVWSAERTAALFTSPIYTGCFSAHRRWRPGAGAARFFEVAPGMPARIGAEFVLSPGSSGLARRRGGWGLKASAVPSHCPPLLSGPSCHAAAGA